MKTFFLIIIVSCVSLLVSAQPGGLIKGKLTDSTANQSLVEAMVSVLHLPDSALTAFTVSDKNGAFEISSLSKGNYVLVVSHSGYSPFKKPFSVSASRQQINLGNLYLTRDYKTLPGVVIKDSSPVRVHGDTISFKSGAFGNKPDATVEDVLKKLPGMQVQKDGTVKAMGETVQKVYVDGKEFFGNDPKLATRNITADMVDQIQVFDDMSEQARFTKIDDGSRTKSVNIKLKKDKNKGDFGKASAGIGTDTRYDGNLFLNHFRGQQRISFVGSANNTNKVNYSFNDYGGGGMSQFSSGGGGLPMVNASTAISPGGVSSPLSAGLNFTDQWGGKVDFRGSYFFADNSNLLRQDKFRQNTFPGDSASEVKTLNEIRNKNQSHRLNGRWEFSIDSMNSVLYNASLQVPQSSSSVKDTSYTVSDASNTYLATTASNRKTDNRNGINYNGELLYRRRFKKPGRTLTMGWRNNSGQHETDSRYISPATSYFPNGTVAGSVKLNQEVYLDNQTGSNILSTSVTESLGVGRLLELNYAWAGSKNMSGKKTYDYDSLTGKYELENLQLTNNFRYRNSSNRLGANFRQQRKKYNFQLGMAVQFTRLENHSRDGSGDKDTVISQRFINLFPTAQFHYAITRTKNIRIFYRGRTNAPSVSQLQDVPDVSNPLQIKTGNPELKPELINNLHVNYNSYQLKKQWFFSGNLNINYTGNKIVNSIDSSASVIIISKPENMNGSYNASGAFSLYFPFRRIKNATWNFMNNTYYSRDASLVYGLKNFTTIFVINQMAGLGFSREQFDVNVSGSLEFNRITYDLESGSNEKYLNQAYSADLSYRFPYNIYGLTDFDYYITTGRAAGYNQQIFLWNMSVAKKFLKNNSAEIKITAYDILKQNKGINRTVGENYYEDVRSNVVPRFYLLSLSYQFNRMGGKKEQKSETPMHYFK